MSITASEARAKLFPLIEQVNDDSEAVEIISKKGRAWLVPDEEYRAWKETDFLLRSPANRDRLLKGVEDVRANRFDVRELPRVCTACDEERQVKNFGTVNEAKHPGVREAECRKCRDARRRAAKK